MLGGARRCIIWSVLAPALFRDNLQAALNGIIESCFIGNRQSCRIKATLLLVGIGDTHPRSRKHPPLALK